MLQTHTLFILFAFLRVFFRWTIASYQTLTITEESFDEPDEEISFSSEQVGIALIAWWQQRDTHAV